MFDLISNVITCCVWSWDTDKVKASDEIMFENHESRENMEIKMFLHKSPLKRLFRHRIDSLLRRADDRGSANIICRIWRLSL